MNLSNGETLATLFVISMKFENFSDYFKINYIHNESRIFCTKPITSFHYNNSKFKLHSLSLNVLQCEILETSSRPELIRKKHEKVQ